MTAAPATGSGPEAFCDPGQSALVSAYDRFGGALPDPMAERGPIQGAMPNEDVGPIVVRGITGNRAYIITHPETAPLVKARQDAVMADYAYFAEAAAGPESR